MAPATVFQYQGMVRKIAKAVAMVKAWAKW